MNSLEKDVDKYLKKIKTLLPKCSFQKKFLQDLETSIFVFVEENKIIDFADIKNQYGSPSKVAGDFLTDMNDTNTDYMLKQKSKTKYIRTAIICIIAILFVGCIVGLSIWSNYNYKAYKELQEYFPTQKETSIEIIE